MAVLNVTHQGLSRDHTVDVPYTLGDGDVRRIAEEIGNLPRGTFADYVVDRFKTEAQGERIYLRPKVPFGA